jgi:sortase A
VSLRLTRKGRRLIVRIVTLAAVVTTLAGIALISYPFYTDRKARTQQDDLARHFQTSALKSAYQQGKVPSASPLTRLVIPRLQVDTIVVEGVSQRALDTGAGHYPSTPLPGEPGNVAIAGHRNTFGKPFAELEKLRPGDRISVLTPIGRHTYEMVPAFDNHPNPWVTEPHDVDVLSPTPESMLTLTTCHPKGSARQRLIARLKLVDSSPTDALSA